jgi:hypothetical protein
MNETNPQAVCRGIRNSVSHLKGAWWGCILLPLPAMVLWRSHDGQGVALWCFCAACFYLAACSFGRHLASDGPIQPWSQKMLATGAALVLAWAVFSLLWLLLVDPHEWVAQFIGLQILIPSLCVVPYLTLLTRRPFAAVVFSAFLLGCAKGVAGIVVDLVYGWNGGHHEFPWTAPNLMISTFWAAAAVLCAGCYCLGARRFRVQHGMTRLPNEC